LSAFGTKRTYPDDLLLVHYRVEADMQPPAGKIRR
jgi:hypothetical protein